MCVGNAGGLAGWQTGVVSRVVLAWLATVCTTASALALACGAEDTSALGSDPTAPVPVAETGSAACPDQAPEEGASCTQPEGTACAAGPCGTTYFACRSGAWVPSPPPPEQKCPGQAPAQGEACPRCFTQTIVCSFGCAVGTTQQAVNAVCAPVSSGGLVWNVTARTCPTFDASAPDAEAQDGS